MARRQSERPIAEGAADAAADAIVDRIYQLATRLDGITETTELLARLTRSRSCGLVIQNRADFRVIGGWFSGMDLKWGLAYRDRYFSCDPTVVEHFTRPPGEAYLSDYSRDNIEFRGSVFFREWCEPQGVGYFAGIYCNLERDQTLRLTFQGDLERGPFEPETLDSIDTLFPHVRRAVDINHSVVRLVGEARAFASALEGNRNAIALLDLEGNVVHANSAAQQSFGTCFVIRNRRVHVAETARQQFELAVAGCVAALRESTDATLQSGVHVSIPRAGLLPLSIYLSPFRLTGASPHDPVPSDLVMLQISDPERQVGLDTERFREVLGLTVAQARVAAHLCQGGTAQAIGVRLGLSPHTVRDHVKHIYLRVGVSKQSEFVARAYSVLGPTGTAG